MLTCFNMVSLSLFEETVFVGHSLSSSQSAVVNQTAAYLQQHLPALFPPRFHRSVPISLAVFFQEDCREVLKKRKDHFHRLLSEDWHNRLSSTPPPPSHPHFELLNVTFTACVCIRVVLWLKKKEAESILNWPTWGPLYCAVLWCTHSPSSVLPDDLKGADIGISNMLLVVHHPQLFCPRLIPRGSKLPPTVCVYSWEKTWNMLFIEIIFYLLIKLLINSCYLCICQTCFFLCR